MSRSPSPAAAGGRLRRQSPAQLTALASALDRAGLGDSDAARAVADELAIRRALLCLPRSGLQSEGGDDAPQSRSGRGWMG